jgi:hypothetical protein
VRLPRNKPEWQWFGVKAAAIGGMLLVCWLLAGCGAINWMRYGDVGAPLYIIHDTVHDDYWGDKGYTTKGNATKMFRWKAEDIITKHRVNEEGEYADTGSNKDYPLQVEEVKP